MATDKDLTIPAAVNDAVSSQEEAHEAAEMLLDEPTSAATVSITCTPEGLGVTASAPDRWSGYTLHTLNSLSATAATATGPVLLLKVSQGTGMPWQAATGFALLLTLMPLAYLLLSIRHTRA
ncbi:hypothetical protein [Streptomyces millisiae]|uniref:Uncharacterized protein n=1 Tax=Streptomyces millisiae TaxID=3075542 RepID=A0ABU2LJW5_9ACTN|nr:hypothetical protein [Streptomyces sp. DSM 44918]MDT0317869.1 hypothetical protein [Streptomyces sp. DSM 44918]